MPESSEPRIPRLTEAFRESIRQQRSLDAALASLLEATGARAAGLWRLRDDSLMQLGFRGCDDMPRAVQDEFSIATRSVPLERAGLGIVKAVLSGQPAISEREPGNRDLSASPGWLERFECERSLALPLRANGRIIGVLAFSTTAPLSETLPPWTVLTAVADVVSEELAVAG